MVRVDPTDLPFDALGMRPLALFLQMSLAPAQHALVQHLAVVSGMAQVTAPQALDVHFTWPLCPGVIDLVDPVQVVLRWDVVVDGDFVLNVRLESLEGVCALYTNLVVRG
jgi:hypothetical protein